MIKRKDYETYVSYSILFIVVVGVLFNLTKMFWPMDSQQPNEPMIRNSALTKISFTSFDEQKAQEFMDTNGDGLCDICGMRIEDCIASGMMQCTMDTSATIGLLGSQHIHADIKIYINGNQLNLADSGYWVKSKFVHVENDGPDKSGNVVHVHAKGITVGFFLESLGIETDNLQLYVNSQLLSNGLNYAFKNRDKILITDSIDKSEVTRQLSSITEYSPPL